MKTFSIVLIILMLSTSLINYILCAADKAFAKKNRRRIPEKYFFMLALFGGGLGLWLGMISFRHKTRHWYFWLAAISATLVQGAALLWVALKISNVL